MAVIVQNSTEKGKGVFAQRAFSIGEKILVSNYLHSVDERDMYSLQYEGEHIIIDEPGVIVNHSCDPNCRLMRVRHDWLLSWLCKGDSCQCC